MSDRDDFSVVVKRTVAERAAYRCSRPECRILTVAPHSQPEKSLSKGVAAHICAAALGGPRFDPNQTEEERSDINNAIWLCHNCSDLIDKDQQKYTKDILLRWKTEHERFIMEGGGCPSLPEIVIKTMDGLTLPSTGHATIRAEDVATYREHVLTINNQNRQIMSYFKCRIQFPELVIGYRVLESPVGATVNCEPDIMEFVAHATGSGSVTITPGRGALDYRLAVDVIPPKSRLRIHFISIHPDDFLPEHKFPDADDFGLLYHVLGEFQYELYNEYLTRNFLVPLEFDSTQRKINSLPCEDYDRTRKIAIRMS